MDISGLTCLRDGLAGAAGGAVADVCERIKDESAALCPVESGALRASIRAETVTEGGTVRGAVIAGESYAVAVELGTWKQAPKPFLAPAFALAVDEVMGALTDGVGALL